MKYGSLFVWVVLIAIFMMFNTACQNKKGPETAKGLNRIHFDFDNASIKPDMVSVLDANARYLKQHRNLKVVVEGHCDERGTNEYNLALGDRRAVSAKTYLAGKGIGDSRLKTASYGEERPLEAEHGEAAWYMNRRADFVRQ